MPDSGGVIPSARIVAPRAMQRAIVQETPCARMRKMSLPAKRVPPSCETLRIDGHALKAASAGAAATDRSAAVRKARARGLTDSAPIPARCRVKPAASRHQQRDDLPRPEVDEHRVAVHLRRAEVVLEQVRPARRFERETDANARPPAAAVGLVEAQDERVGPLGALPRVEDEAGPPLDRPPRRRAVRRGAPP